MFDVRFFYDLKSVRKIAETDGCITAKCVRDFWGFENPVKFLDFSWIFSKFFRGFLLFSLRFFLDVKNFSEIFKDF